MSKMSKRARNELLESLKPKYNNANYASKQRILDAFVTATGCNRKHAIVIFSETKKEKQKKRNGRRKIYDASVIESLKKIWEAAGCICSKRLVPFLPDLIPTLERCNYIVLEPAVRQLLLSMSSATVDRLLKKDRVKTRRLITRTRAVNTLRKQIAIRTSEQWIDIKPGYLEIDLVAHNGGNPTGRFINTLTLTDVTSGWTECLAIISKSGDEVLEAIIKIRKELPFKILGLDSDNGGEFINKKLADYCIAESIVFTRSREYRKNDQAHVEEKNGSIVRKLVGYRRYEGDRLLQLLKELYGLSRLYINFFQPSLKLESRVRDGARITKRYQKAKTPCQRLLESEHLDASAKHKLRQKFNTLDPIWLLNAIEQVQTELEINSKNLKLKTEILSSEIQHIPTEEKVPLNESGPVTEFQGGLEAKKTGRKSIVTPKIAQEIAAILHQDPSMTATAVLPILEKRYPGMFGLKQWATLSRVINKWRAAHPQYNSIYPANYRQFRS